MIDEVPGRRTPGQKHQRTHPITCSVERLNRQISTDLPHVLLHDKSGAMRISIAILALSLMACGDDDGSSAAPTCGQVCSHIMAQCGTTPPGCESICSGFSDQVRSCVVGASSCAAANACGSGGSDAGNGNDAGNPPMDGGMDSGPAECTIGEIANCPGPSASCTCALINDATWCSPTCDDNSVCGSDYVCNGSGGYCVPPRTSGNPSCPAPFTECEVSLGSTDGYCR